jgi:hypothetical protein
MKLESVALAVFFSNILPCCAANEQTLKQVHDAEAKFIKAQDDRPSIDWDGLRKLESLEKKLFVLKLGGRPYLATHVFKSHNLKGGFDLSSIVADDTIHVTEGDFTAIKCKAKDGFKVDIAWRADSLSHCDFYLGHPGQMHADGYRSVVKLAFKGGSVTLPVKMPKRDMLLFAIVKPKNDDYFKFVFVVRADN